MKIKNKDIHIRISDDKLKELKIIAEKDRRKVTAVIDIAIERFLRSRYGHGKKWLKLVKLSDRLNILRK